MKNWKLKSLVGLAALVFASSASAQHGHGVYQSMKVLDRETDHLKEHFTQFMRSAHIAQSDPHYFDLLCAIRSFEKHADHIRSAYENRRGFHAIALEVQAAKMAASQVRFHMHDHLKIPRSLDQDFHAAECALKSVAAVYTRQARAETGHGRGHQSAYQERGHEGHGHSIWNRRGPSAPSVEPCYESRNSSGSRSINLLGSRGLTLRFGR